MSLLDKIAGLAQKAKDNVVSKTFISKDKRLEQSLSNNIKVNNLFFEKISTYGIPSSVGAVAFDCVSGLLAVAGDTNQSYIKIFGKGISTKIKLPKAAGIKYLQFKTGFPILVVIDKANTIITVDLRTKTAQHVLPAQEIITSHTYCTGTDWLFVGYANGYIDVFDIMQGTLTPYQIPNLMDSEDHTNAKNHVVVELQMHPTELNTLLIGYEDIIYIWSIRESTIRKSFSLRKLDDRYQNVNLTCLTWSPSGSRFVGGYDDGSIHVWDIKFEQKPISSRKISQVFVDEEIAEPIYQVAWYANTVTKKTHIIVAGGSTPSDIRGLNILEYDLDSDAKEAKKQTVMPLPTDLSHFILLSNEPYYLGMINPFSIAVVDVYNCIRSYSLEHGNESLKLPPALEFLDPNVLSACHILLPSPVFEKLSAIPGNRHPKWLPIIGGSTGPEHTYQIDSNDLLITIHDGEVIKFWDASYTALRPLNHLSIHCLEDLENQKAILCCLDVNKENGTFSIGYSDGSIVIYTFYAEPVPEPVRNFDPKFVSNKNDEIINDCDDTLKDLSDILKDMEDTDPHNNELLDQTSEATITNPFLAVESPSSLPPFTGEHKASNAVPATQTTHDHATGLSRQSPETPSRHFSKLDNIFKILEKPRDKSGFYGILKITLGSPIRSIISINSSIIAAALEDGTIVVVDIQKQAVLFSYNICQSDFENTVTTLNANLKSETVVELQEADPVKEEQKKPAQITVIKFFDTYLPNKCTTIASQLFVGLSNGHIYQFNFSLIEKEQLFIEKKEALNDFLTIRANPASSILELHVIDIKGATHVAQMSSVRENVDSLTKEQSHHSTDSTPGSIGEEDNSVVSPKPASITSNTSSVITSSSNNSNNNNNTPSKRMMAIGKMEYRHQENPHLIVSISLTGINVVLSGFIVKLFYKEFKEFTIVRGEIIHCHDGVCLCLLLSNGRLAFYSLPSLDLMLEMALPNSCIVDRLGEASISEDGKVIFWTGRYEMEQYSFVPNPDFPIGESVILFDAQQRIPPHPSLLAQQQKSDKKTWINTVAGAFQKEPLSLAELDSLMGRVPTEDPNEVHRKKVEAYKQKMSNKSESSSSKGPGGVFSQLGEKMNERGEKLNQLDKKFEDMNAASGDFLKSIKEYNERQARKKWWEF